MSMESSQWGTGSGSWIPPRPLTRSYIRDSNQDVPVSPLTQTFLKIKIKCWRCSIKGLEAQRKGGPAPSPAHGQSRDADEPRQQVRHSRRRRTLPAASCRILPVPSGAAEGLCDTHRWLDQMEPLDCTATSKLSPDLMAKSCASLLVWRARSDPGRNPYPT